MATLVILTVLTIVILSWWMVVRHRERSARARMSPLPLISIPAPSSAPPIPRPRTPPLAAGDDTTWAGPNPAGAVGSPYNAGGVPVIRTREGMAAALGASSTVPATSGFREDAGSAAGEAVEGASVRYWRPADGTLQFLPGRLEVVAGHDAGQEIRFVRTPGPDGARVTFGRAEGPPYRHVQLREPTVSRAHARMALEPGGAAGAAGAAAAGASGWRLENLSATNPVVVNGRALAGDGGPGGSVLLRDGDRIEMGEVAFVFHAR